MKQRLLILLCVSILLGGATIIYSRGTASTVQLGTFTAGGDTRESPNYRNQDVIGQWVVGNSTSPNHQIITGLYWSGDAQALHTVYLPIIRK